MSDTFQIIPYKVRSAGTDVPPEEVQAAINSLAQQTTVALNSVASDPTGPAGGDLSGTYPNPTVAAVHATSGTLNGVVIGGVTPAAGHFTTLDATTPVAVTSGGTGRNALTANAVVIGEGSSQVNFAAPGTAGGMLISQGAAADPAFANNPTITGGSINSTPVGNTTPSTGAFTTLSASSGLNSTAVGNTTPSTGSFTTLAASGAVTGAGFTARFSSPGPIGNTTPSTGAFTTLSATTPIAVSSGGTGLGTLTAGEEGMYLVATCSRMCWNSSNSSPYLRALQLLKSSRNVSLIASTGLGLELMMRIVPILPARRLPFSILITEFWGTAVGKGFL